jgi:hypothetical protein
MCMFVYVVNVVYVVYVVNVRVCLCMFVYVCVCLCMTVRIACCGAKRLLCVHTTDIPYVSVFANFLGKTVKSTAKIARHVINII